MAQMLMQSQEKATRHLQSHRSENPQKATKKSVFKRQIGLQPNKYVRKQLLI
jgi:hypothetical protein